MNKRTFHFGPDGLLVLGGWPPGSAAVGLTKTVRGSPEAAAGGHLEADYRRLTAHAKEFQEVARWATLGLDPRQPDDIRDACALAAFVRFAACFDNRRGGHPPLSPKIFGTEDRKVLKRLVKIRNRVAAHDDGIASDQVCILVIGKDLKAVDTVCIQTRTPASAFVELQAVGRLAVIAAEWIRDEAARVRLTLNSDFDALPEAERTQIRTLAPFRAEMVWRDQLADGDGAQNEM